MKSLFSHLSSILAFALVTSPALAADFGRVTGTDPNKVAIGYAAVQLLGQSELCPQGVTCVTNGTVIELLLSYGCGTQPERVVANTLEVGDELHVFVAAPVITYPNRIAMCIVPSIKKETVTLINKYGKVVLHEVNSQTGR
ncbi:MAG: hypothetical protein V4760_06800 [Bdellovibrionota bacterium]